MKWVLSILLLIIGGCTVIKNYGTLHYVSEKDVKVIDWHPNRHPGYNVFSKERVDTSRTIEMSDSIK